MFICSLDVHGFIFSWQQPGNWLSSCGTVIPKGQRRNFNQLCSLLLNFEAGGLIPHYIVLYFLQGKPICAADKI